MFKTRFILPFKTINDKTLVWTKWSCETGGYFSEEDTIDDAVALVELVTDEEIQHRMYAYQLYWNIQLRKCTPVKTFAKHIKYHQIIVEQLTTKEKNDQSGYKQPHKKWNQDMVKHLSCKVFRKWCRDNKPTEK